MAASLRARCQEINLLLEKDCLCWAEINRLECKLEAFELRFGALKAQVDHVAPMVVDLTEADEEEEVVEVPPPVVAAPVLVPVQVVDAFGAGLLQAVVEWGAEDGTDSDIEEIFYDPEGAVVEVRDFAEEERQQAREPGVTEQAEIERAAADLALPYDGPPAYEP